MTTGGADPVFVDTNVLVFATVPQAPLHAIAIAALRRYTQLGAPLWLSRQVLREFLATLTRSQIFGGPIAPSALIAQVRFFERRFHIAEDSPRVTAQLLALLQRIPIGGKQVHDANIVATMQAYGITRLLTDNTGDFARFAGIITVEPLMATT